MLYSIRTAYLLLLYSELGNDRDDMYFFIIMFYFCCSFLLSDVGMGYDGILLLMYPLFICTFVIIVGHKVTNYRAVRF